MDDEKIIDLGYDTDWKSIGEAAEEVLERVEQIKKTASEIYFKELEQELNQ